MFFESNAIINHTRNEMVVQELPRFQELIFEDFSRFILVENIFEEVVLHTVMKDIMMGKTHTCFQTMDETVLSFFLTVNCFRLNLNSFSKLMISKWIFQNVGTQWSFQKHSSTFQVYKLAWQGDVSITNVVVFFCLADCSLWLFSTNLF